MFVELQGIHSYSPSMAGKSVQHCSLLHSGLPLHMGITPLCLGLHNDDFGYGLFVWNESWHSSDRDFCRRWYFHGSSVQQGLSRQVHRKVASQSGDRRHSVWKSLKKSNLTHFVTLQAKWAFIGRILIKVHETFWVIFKHCLKDLYLEQCVVSFLLNRMHFN